MDVSKPLQALFPTVDSAVLSVLAEARKPRTGREIARRAERSQPAVQAVLDRFVDQGLVHREEAGRSRVYVMNREHLAAPSIEALTRLRNQLFDRIRREIRGWDIRPFHASLFGSAARGDGGPHSDIDIFLVRPKGTPIEDPRWDRQVDALATAIYNWTGNHAGIAQVAEGDLESLRRERPPVFHELATDAVDLAGERATKVAAS